jgi:hypothetical protein
MHGLRAQQSLLLEYKTCSNEKAADNGEDNSDNLNRIPLSVGNDTTLNSEKPTLSLLPPAESPAAAEEVAAAADPVAVADAEEDMFFGGSRRVVTSGLQSKLIQPQACSDAVTGTATMPRQ